MKRRTVLGAALAASLALTLVGCGSSNTGSDQGAELTLAGWSLSSTPEFQTLADGFNKTNPKLKVTLKEYDATNYDTQMVADLAAGTAPDLYPIKNQRSFFTYASGAQLVDVSDVAAGLEPGPELDSNTLDGKTYAIPYRAGRDGSCTTTRICSTRPASRRRTAAGPGTTTPRSPRSSHRT